MPWPQTFSRETVRGDIEEATAHGLSVEDSLPDSLIACAERLGLQPVELRLWIYDEPKRGDWSTAALAAWAMRHGVANDQPEDIPAPNEEEPLP